MSLGVWRQKGAIWVCELSHATGLLCLFHFVMFNSHLVLSIYSPNMGWNQNDSIFRKYATIARHSTHNSVTHNQWTFTQRTNLGRCQLRKTSNLNQCKEGCYVKVWQMLLQYRIYTSRRLSYSTLLKTYWAYAACSFVRIHHLHYCMSYNAFCVIEYVPPNFNLLAHHATLTLSPTKFTSPCLG